MKETLSIMQMIAEEKAIRKKVYQLLSDDFKFISYYQRNRPYCGARTAEEQEKDQKQKLQSLNDLLYRFSAIKKAHTKANRETFVVVPEEPSLFNLINGKAPSKERITIAEAINRKNVYKKGDRIDSTIPSLETIAYSMLNLFNKQFNAKSSYDDRARSEIEEQLRKRFPSDSKNSWSQDKYTETKKQLEDECEVIRIDPYHLIESDTIRKFYDQIQIYLLEIDTIISQANASTIIEFEY